MRFQALKERFLTYHPAIQALIFTLPVSLTVFAHYFFAGEILTEKSPIELLKREYKNLNLDEWSGIAHIVLWDPLKEEVLYRGPVVLVVWFAGIFKHPFKKTVYRGTLAFAYALMIGLTFYWAFFAIPHRLPITVFGYGLIWGWLAIQTRFIAYSILFHMGCNAIAVLAMIFAHHIL